MERVRCFHCGESCPPKAFTAGEKSFCCQGCRVVHELLAEAGLDRFYELGLHPGIRVRGAARADQWAYLDDPAVRGRLLDFSDGKLSRVTFRLPAIHCVACVWLLENLFRLHPAIGRSVVHFSRREATIDFATDGIRLSELAGLLASIGYEPSLTLAKLGDSKPPSLRKRQWIQVGVAGFAFGNIMLFSLPLYLGMDSVNGPAFRSLFGWLSLALALPVLVCSASDYWRSAWLSLRQRTLALEVPIALGLAALYAQSAWEILSGRGGGYLDSLCGLVFFLLCGRAFQQKTHDRLAFDLDYKSFFPLSAARRAARQEERVAISELRVGDRVLVRNGELIPADAALADGPARIDYSFVTGESEPVAKAAGDYLYAGGRQCGGVIEVEIAKPVSQSYLATLWNHETFRKDGRGDRNSLTDRYSRVFTWIVIGIAAGAAVFWSASGNLARALLVFTAVLIVACPCALALAAPFTLGSAQRLLARRGVFLRNGAVLERMAAVDTVVFDKTGTLTAADSAAASFEGGALTAEEERWVASLARQSTHPHSARVHQLLTGRGSPEPVESFLEMPGLGLEGSVRGHAVVLGSAAWLELRGARVETGTAPPAGGSVHVAIDGRRRGAFVLGGCLCPEAEAMLRRLARGCSIELLSGDNARQIEAFRHLFGDPSRLNFNQSPTDKLGYVRSLQGRGKTVMMVGDGLNDAGALKQGDVGVAVVERAGVFSPASDVILEAGQVPRLAALVAVARGASRAVKMSLGLSAVYNIVGISIAAAGGFSPLVCAILMPLSSISVVLFACAASGRVVRREWPDTAGAAGAARLGAAAAAGGALEPAEAAA